MRGADKALPVPWEGGWGRPRDMVEEGRLAQEGAARGAVGLRPGHRLGWGWARRPGGVGGGLFEHAGVRRGGLRVSVG